MRFLFSFIPPIATSQRVAASTTYTPPIAALPTTLTSTTTAAVSAAAGDDWWASNSRSVVLGISVGMVLFMLVAAICLYLWNRRHLREMEDGDAYAELQQA